jgi:hypothetical protein
MVELRFEVRKLWDSSLLDLEAVERAASQKLKMSVWDAVNKLKTVYLQEGLQCTRNI